MARRLLLEGPGCVCKGDAANLLSMEWLTEHSSILLWADCIVISQADFDYVCSGFCMGKDRALGQTYALFFERLKHEGLVATFDPKTTIPRISTESVESFVFSDIERYGTTQTEDSEGKISPSVVETCFGSFCGVALESIYMNLLASRLLGCSCLMDRNKAEFVNARFGSHVPAGQEGYRAFNELYAVLVPELNPHETHRLFCAGSIRANCTLGNECERQIAENVNDFIDSILVMKSIPEIQGLSSLVERIEAENPEADSLTITRAALRDIAKAQRKLRDVYSHAQRWTKIVGETSLAAVSVALTSPMADIATPLAAATGIGGLVASAAIDAVTMSNQWKITFAENYLTSR